MLIIHAILPTLGQQLRHFCPFNYSVRVDEIKGLTPVTRNSFLTLSQSLCTQPTGKVEYASIMSIFNPRTALGYFSCITNDVT